MWQAATFDAATIDRELGWAAMIGMNAMRVYLHDLLWTADADAFLGRVRAYLDIADTHRIRTMFVLFDSCWDPEPSLGPQPPPIPGVHNSRWVQSPGWSALSDPAQTPRLRAYVEGVVGALAKDQRVLAWDVWNEPDNANMGRHVDPPGKGERVVELLPQAFSWARTAGPSQPLTCALWRGGDWSRSEELSEIQRIAVANSDVLTFHCYAGPEAFQARVAQLDVYQRPIICTEYLARGAGSTFESIVPLGRRLDVGLINWGLVAGRSQTNLPWDSWRQPYIEEPPAVWHHDVFLPDGRPYRAAEAEVIKAHALKQRTDAGDGYWLT